MSQEDESLVRLAGLADQIGYALRRAQLAVFQDFNRSLAEFDLRPAQFSALAIIRARPGLRQQQVSSALGIQGPNMATLLDELQRRDLVRRAPAPSDRRSYALYLTEPGEALMARVLPAQQAHEARLAALLGADGKQCLLALLDRLAAPREG